jgi:hypothetical protein
MLEVEGGPMDRALSVVSVQHVMLWHEAARIPECMAFVYMCE